MKILKEANKTNSPIFKYSYFLKISTKNVFLKVIVIFSVCNIAHVQSVFIKPIFDYHFLIERLVEFPLYSIQYSQLVPIHTR